MLNAIIDNLDDIDEGLKSSYKEGDDKKFYLQVTGADGAALEDVSGYKKANGHIKADLAAANDKNKALQEKLSGFESSAAENIAAAEKAAREKLLKEKDFDSMDKSWNEKYTSLEQTAANEANELKALLHKNTVENVASTIASDLATKGSEQLLKPFIMERLTMEVKDGTAVTTTVNSDGTASALTIDELKKELKGDKRFANIIVGSKADGSGASNNDSGGGASNPQNKRSKMSSKEKVDYISKYGNGKFLSLPD